MIVDTLHRLSSPTATWSTTNLSESIPGVPTPLGWSIWEPAGELAVRRTFHEIGALSAADAAVPADPGQRLLGIFYGRAALRVDLLCDWVERVPGTDSAAMAQAAFSAVPEGYVSRNAYRYFPRVLARATVPFFKAPRLIRRHAPVVRGLREQALRQLPDASAMAARKWLAEGACHWREGLFNNTLVTMGAVQPAIDMLERLAATAGCSGQGLMAGHGGHQETEVVADAWACARGRLPFQEFIARHGYHGWQEGEISARVWREDPEPAREFIERYAGKADSADPLTAECQRGERRQQLESEFLAALPRHRRVQGRLALWLAATYVPLRGAGKVTFLEGLDVARAAARRLGERLADAGELDDPDDVFFLTFDELQAPLRADRRELIAQRRAARDRYQLLEIPEAFRGTPQARTEDTPNDAVIEGTAASPGIVEGVVRVVLDVSDGEINEGEILVGHTTDPSWVSLMFLSSGLITDIGGTLSHTAVVARELGLPCVVNTKIATKALNTGDFISLDGTTGRIEILARGGQNDQSQ